MRVKNISDRTIIKINFDIDPVIYFTTHDGNPRGDKLWSPKHYSIKYLIERYPHLIQIGDELRPSTVTPPKLLEFSRDSAADDLFRIQKYLRYKKEDYSSWFSKACSFLPPNFDNLVNGLKLKYGCPSWSLLCRAILFRCNHRKKKIEQTETK